MHALCGRQDARRYRQLRDALRMGVQGLPGGSILESRVRTRSHILLESDFNLSKMPAC